MKITPLNPFGADIEDIDTRNLSAADRHALVEALTEHHVLRIRGQTLDKAEYDRFGRSFGDPIDFFFTKDLDADFPALITISNSPDHDMGRRDGASFWHTDGSYEYVPASTTMLYAVEAPERGGETRFTDLTAAYEALPEATRQRIEGLKAQHMLVGGKRGPDETPIRLDPDEANRDGGVRARKRAAERPLHPLVITHPISGRRNLYAVGGTPYGIEGLDSEEGERLLGELKAHSVDPRFTTEIKAEAGDILIWDNRATMHRATPIEYSGEDGKRRRMLRISTQGLPPSHADRTPLFVAPEGHVSIKLA
jgi:taurine dioxygenase